MDTNGYLTRWTRLVLAMAMALALSTAAVGTGQPASAADPVVAVDDAGPDDEPGQKDLNSLSIDYGNPGATNLAVTFNFDSTSTTGANTLDGCALFDTDGDGLANFAQCHTISSDGTQAVSQYRCTADSRADRCAGPAEVFGFASSSSAAIVAGSDPFQSIPSHTSGNTCKTSPSCYTDDYVVTADIAVIADFGSSATLINVCSYPSRQPNSDPSDCVFAPNNGFLTIIKTTDQSTTQEFVFDASPASANGSNQFSTTGAGTVSTISYAPTTALDISEVVPAEWTLNSASCEIQTATPSPTGSAAAAGVDDLEIRSGLMTVCTFDNSKRVTSLTLVKDVINDNGGTAVTTDWTVTADGGPTPISGPGGVTSDGPFQAGTYDLSESTGPAGYQLSSLTCDKTGDTQIASVSIAIGDQVTCTFVNDDDAPSLTLVKQVVNDNGGAAAPGDFTLTATGYDEVSPAAGSYDLSETGPAGYTQISLTCDNAAGQVTSVTLGLGDDVTCTFVNDDNGPGLTLVKEVVNDNGGAAAPGDFTLVAAGYDAADPQSGSYDLSETGPAGYTQTSLTCDNSVGQVTSVTLGLDEQVTCTFVNDDDAPSLTLVKIVTNDNGGTAQPGDFTLTATGYDVVSPNAGSYDLSESGPDGYTLTSLTCANSVGQVTSVTLGLGDDVTCTFVNDDDAPSLTLVKQVVNNSGGTAIPGDFTLIAAGYDAADPRAGSYDLSESGPAGYTQISLTCDDSTGQVTSVTLGLGDDVTCTFVNDDNGPGLTLVKEVVNDNGGTAIPGDFTLSAVGYDAADPQAGSYDLSETGPAGYTQSSLTCDNSVGQVTSVTLGLDEQVTCTFVNGDDAPSLTLVKQVVNNNGGFAQPGDFTLTATGYDSVSPDAGSYDLSESGPAGYTQTSLTCDNSVGQVTSVTLGMGEAVTCTFVNDDDAPSLSLVKEVVNDNGGAAVPGDYTLTATGYDEVSPDAGEYPLSEVGPAGYTQISLTCDNSVGQVTSVTLGLGDDVTCTFVNDDDAPSLTLVKEVVNDNGGAAAPVDFTLTAAGYDVTDPQTGSYDLSESGPAGYTQTSLTCDNSVGQVTSVTLGLGETATCTFVNDDNGPGLTLVKEVVNDNGGSAAPGDFTLTAFGYDSAEPQTGTYALSETGPVGYTQTSLTCDNSVGQVTSVTLGLGETATCTFVNDDDAPSLRLVKEVVNNNGGTVGSGDFTLTAAGYDVADPQTGSYDLSESGPAGYTQISLTCDNSVGQVTSVTLGLGDDVTCTFVNDDNGPGLTLVKEVVNDNGGTAAPGDFTLTAAGYDAADPQTGTYALSETGPAGYSQTSLTCDNSVGQVTSVTLGIGDDVMCTFVNDDDAPSLTLIKELVNDDGGNAEVDEFTLVASGPIDIVGTTGMTSGDDFAAGTYELSETGPAGYVAGDWECDGGSQAGAAVTLTVGETAVCTIINDDEPVDLQLTKDDGGVEAVAGGDPFDYAISVQNIGTRDLDDGEPATVTDVLPTGLAWVSFPANCSRAAQVLTCGIEAALLPAGGDPVVITATVRALSNAASGTYVNKASVTTEDDTTTNPPCPAVDDNNVDCEETPVDRQGAIQITKTDNVAAGASVEPGATFTYRLVVTNTGVSTILPGTHVEDDLPAQLTFVSAVGGAGWTCNNSDPVDCDYAPALAPGQSAPAIIVTVNVADDAAGASIQNVAVVLGAVDRDCPSATSRLVESLVPACNQVTDDDDESTPLSANADLAIVKTASVDLVGAGGSFEWILDITNNGPGTAVDVVIGDIVPQAVTVTGVDSDDFACSNQGNTVSCNVDSLAVGSSGTVTVAVNVPLTAPDGSLVNVGTVESDTPDPDLSNNSDEASVVVVAIAPPASTLAPVTLPRTGSNATDPITNAALVFLLLGGSFVLITRRRRPDGVPAH